MDFFEIKDKTLIRIRSRFYVSEICRLLDCRINTLSKAFCDRSTGEHSKKLATVRSKMYRYSNGANINDEELVDAVDEILPGTRRIVNHPIWSLLKRYDYNRNQLVDITQKLSPDFVEVFLQKNLSNRLISLTFKNVSRNLIHSEYWNIRARLLKTGGPSLDGLAADLIFVRLSDLSPFPARSKQSRSLLKHTLYTMSQVNHFKEFSQNVFWPIESMYLKNSKTQDNIDTSPTDTFEDYSLIQALLEKFRST